MSDLRAKELQEDMEDLQFTQHLHVSTHTKGHTLDALFSYGMEVSQIKVIEIAWSDHKLVTYNLPDFALRRPIIMNKITKSAPLRKLKNIRCEDFEKVYLSQPLLLIDEERNTIELKNEVERGIERLEAAFNVFEMKLKKTLDTVAPLNIANNRTRATKTNPWFTPNLSLLKTQRRALERRWVKYHLPKDKLAYCSHCCYYAKMAKLQKRTHYNSHIQDAPNDIGELFKIVRELFVPKKLEPKIPDST